MTIPTSRHPRNASIPKALLLCGVLCLCWTARTEQTQAPAPVVVFWEDGFPVVDTAAPERVELAAVLPEAAFATREQLKEALGSKETRLLVLLYGSAFPEECWAEIYAYLERGGNLLVLGGRPFTRPAYHENGVWKLRPPRPAFAKQLFINDYEPTPGAQGLEFQANPAFAHLGLAEFAWSRAYSLMIRLSDEELYPRGGSAGSIDARLDALVWGTRGSRRMSAPLVQIDHLKNHFAGGRWILAPCEMPARFLSSRAGKSVLSTLAAQALEGAEDFQVRPAWPLFLPGEPLSFQLRWMRFVGKPAAATLELALAPEKGPAKSQKIALDPQEFPYSMAITLPPSEEKGFHTVTATLSTGGKVRAVYRTGFWLRDEEFLRSGPRVTLNEDFFEVNGRTQLVLGTTYMASDVQRQFFMNPNPYLWRQDMAELRDAGINTLRTGWWSAWDQVMKESGVVHEEMLRTLEAFLMTARAFELPVQFTFFSFIPEVLGGVNPYMDPEALRRQKELLLAVVGRFKDVPYVVWDLINEPSFSNPRQLWMTRPNRDKRELNAWNEWLKARYPKRAALEEAWRTILPPEPEPVPLPAEEEFSPRAVYQTVRGSNPLKIYDYFLFAQEKFREWVRALREAIRGTGSRQLVTVGQDEGGVRERVSPAFFSDTVDFTTNHTWWLLDDLLWDSLVAKQPGKPLLIQETGVNHQLQIDENARRSPEEEAILLERKLAFALGTSAGAIHWLWHINPYMRDDGEVRIGAVRADRTEKPEAEVLRGLARFAAAASEHVARPGPPQVAIVTSQAFQYSALGWLALEAQTRAVRVLNYQCRVPGYVVVENQLARLGNPRLVILPSPHALSEEAWQQLLKYVTEGGNLLITGSVERDTHWRATQRLALLGLGAVPQPLAYRQGEILIGEMKIPVSFDSGKQPWIEGLRMPFGETFQEQHWGKGKLFVSSYPLELAEGPEPTAILYGWVLKRVGIEPPFVGRFPSPGVLIRPVNFAESVLYLFVSESASDEEIDVKDRATGSSLRFRLPAQRASLVLLRKRDGKVLARYGFPENIE